MRQRIILMLCLIGMAVSLQAQTISGKLVDEKNQPLAYANVVLQQADSTFIDGKTSDEKGDFRIEAPKAGNYLLTISSVGYRTQLIRLNDLNKRRNLGTIVIQETSELLGEVSVTANSTVRKIDRQIIYPSAQQLKQSGSGYDLLSKLMIPDLKINMVQNSVSTIGGGQVQIRINDIKATTAQVLALNPSEVVRVEFIDNPDARYGNTEVEAVVNYIVKRRNSGMSGGFTTMNALTTGLGNNNIYAKANTGLSEFGVNYAIYHRDYDDRFASGFDKYTFPDGTSRNRILEGMSVPFGYVQQEMEASYNLTQPDKYVFNVVFRNSAMDTDKQNFAYRVIEEGHPARTSYEHATDHNNSPALDLYLNYKLPNNQSLTANVVGTYMNTDYMRDYKEYETEDEWLSHYQYSTNGKKYSLIGEAIYSKSWDKTILNAGLKGNMAYTKNEYTGDAESNLGMHNSNLYGYLQLKGKLQKLDYMIGAGITRQEFSQGTNRYDFLTFRPSASLTYPIFKGARLRYTFSMSPYNPSLSQLSDIRQQVNDLEYRRGNKDLKSYRGYNNRLNFDWNYKRVSIQWSGQYIYYNNPIRTSVTAVQTGDGSYYLEYAPMNWRSHKKINSRLNLQWNVIPDHLSISGYGNVDWYKSEKEDIANEYTWCSAGGNVNASLGNFSLTAGADLRTNSLSGYRISYGESNSFILLSYNYKSLNGGVYWYLPFQKAWKAGYAYLNNPYQQKKSWTYIEDNGNMVCLHLSWRFSSGRKHKAGQKTLSNSDNDSGIVK